MSTTSRARRALPLLLLAGLLLHGAEVRAGLMPPEIDDRTYDDLVTELAERIPAHTPEWTDFNESDPGFALIDFFAVIDDPALNDIVLEYHERDWWKALPIDSDAFLGELAFSLLEAALVVALPPDSPVPDDWPKRYGVDVSLSFVELIRLARAPEPGSVALLGFGLAALLLAVQRRRV